MSHFYSKHNFPSNLSQLHCVQDRSVITVGSKFPACTYLHLNQSLMSAFIDLAEMDPAVFYKLKNMFE